MDLDEQKIIHADRFYLLHTTCVKHVEQDEEFVLVVCFLFFVLTWTPTFKKNCFIYFNESPLKMIKNAFISS